VLNGPSYQSYHIPLSKQKLERLRSLFQTQNEAIPFSKPKMESFRS
jgi:hypothetical protein